MRKPADQVQKKTTPATRRRTATRGQAVPGLTKPRERAMRMSPDARRNLILETAAKMVLAHGVSGCTPEAVAVASSISRPLVYKYFPTRDALLGALLQREFDHVRGRSESLVPPEAPSQEIRRVYVRRYLEYVMERGALMRALINDIGAVGHAGEVKHIQQASITQYWVEKTMETYGVPKELARMGTIMTIRAMEGAEGSLKLGKVDLDSAADFWTTFILAGWEAVGAKLSKSSAMKRKSND